MNRNILRDATIIVGLASVLAVAYNAIFSVKPLPWIRQHRVIDTATVDVLRTVLEQPTKASLINTDTSTRESVSGNTPQTAPLHSESGKKGTQQTQPPAASPPRLPPLNDAVPPPQSQKVHAVTYNQVLMMLRNEDVIFMDARRHEEYQQGHIPRAVNVDIQLFELDPNYRNTTMQMLYSLDKQRPIVTYCGGGNCELSHKLSDVLLSLGFEHVFIYLGGWNEYSAKPDAPR